MFAVIWRYLWSDNSTKVKGLFIISVLALTLSKVFTVLVPVALKDVVDRLSIGIEGIPIVLLVFYGVSRFASQAFNELKEICFMYVGQDAVRNLAQSIFRTLTNLSLKFHLDRKTGGVNLSINRAVRALETLLSFMTFMICPIIFELTITCGVIFWLYDLTYLIITSLTLIFYVSFTIFVTKKRTKYIKQMKQAENAFNDKAVDVLLNYETVKYFCKEDKEECTYSRLLRDYSALAIKNKFFLAILNLGQVLIIALGLTALMIFAAQAVMQGEMTVGDFLLVNLYLLQLYQPLGNLGFAYREVTMSLVDLEDMQDKVSESDTFGLVESVGGAKVIGDASIEFKDIHFAYNQEREILKGLSFSLPHGKMLAVVGSSGAGKSTIARLIYRFYEFQSGDILFGGCSVKNLDVNFLRSKIGIVPQDTVLFNESIYYNIAYGSPKESITVEEVERAAKMANIHDFIISLPDKYATTVGERGLKLSGGEKQRIAIARVLLKNPDVYIFDEATSALDTTSEKVIQESIKKIAHGKTAIVIAHRLSTIVDADIILVISDGIVVEVGSHRWLINANGAYHALWMQQQRQGEEIH